MCYTCANWASLFVCALFGVNVNISTSTIDVGVQCDIIPLPLMTSTPTQSIDSQEGEDSSLPQDHGEDNLSQSWGDITEEPREVDCSGTAENDVVEHSTM